MVAESAGEKKRRLRRILCRQRQSMFENCYFDADIVRVRQVEIMLIEQWERNVIVFV